VTWDRSTVIPVILERIANGESLRKICKDDGLPSAKQVHEWLAEDAELSEHYARATEGRADTYFDRALDVVAERPPLVIDSNHKAGDGAPRMDSAYVAWQRVQMDALKWAAGQLAPKKYGKQAVDLTHAGPDGGPIQARCTVEFVGTVAGSLPLPVADQS
jgi:hypothetical protein